VTSFSLGLYSDFSNLCFRSNEASRYDSKHERSIQQITEAIQARLDFIGVAWVGEDEDVEGRDPENAVRLLDYACGTGLMSRVWSTLDSNAGRGNVVLIDAGTWPLRYPMRGHRHK
jgi:hypothetical protein